MSRGIAILLDTSSGSRGVCKLRVTGSARVRVDREQFRPGRGCGEPAGRGEWVNGRTRASTLPECPTLTRIASGVARPFALRPGRRSGGVAFGREMFPDRRDERPGVGGSPYQSVNLTDWSPLQPKWTFTLLTSIEPFDWMVSITPTFAPNWRLHALSPVLPWR